MGLNAGTLPNFQEFIGTATLTGGIIEFDNSAGFASIGFLLTTSPAASGAVVFEGSYNGTTWVACTLRQQGVDAYTQFTQLASETYIGSISCFLKFRLRIPIGVGGYTINVIGRATQTLTILEGVEHSAAPHQFGEVVIRKDFSFTTSQTATAIWTPTVVGTVSKKFIVTDIQIATTGATGGAVRIFDSTDTTGNYLFSGTLAINQVVISNLRTPFESLVAGNILRITTTGGIDVDGVIHGYEVF